MSTRQTLVLCLTLALAAAGVLLGLLRGGPRADAESARVGEREPGVEHGLPMETRGPGAGRDPVPGDAERVDVDPSASLEERDSRRFHWADHGWRGQVLDAISGEPVGGARVTVCFRPTEAEPAPWGPIRVSPRWTTDEMGAFHRHRAHRTAGVRLAVEAPGYGQAVIEPVPGQEHLGTILLEPARGPVVFGTVRLPGGEPAAGALVQLGPHSARAAEDGGFRLPALGPLAREDLTASLHPHGLARLPGVGDRLTSPVQGPLTLTLERVPWAEVSGRVVGTDGVPGKGLRVDVLGGFQAPRAVHRTRSDGAFVLAGLDPRERYTLVARDRGGRVAGLLESVQPPAAGRVLTVGDTREVSGRVIGSVDPQAVVVTLEAPTPQGPVVLRGRVPCDEEGFFRATVPVSNALRAWVAGTEVQRFEADLDPAGGPLRLVAEPLRWRTLTCDARPFPDALWAADPSGASVGLRQGRGGVEDRIHVRGGYVEALATGPRAHELVLEAEGRELGRIPLDPQVTHLHWPR